MARRSLLLGGLLATAPAATQACGFCVDAALLRTSWWIAGTHVVAGVLFLEFLLYGVLNVFLKQAHRSRGRWILLAVALAIGGMVVSGGSGHFLWLGLGSGLAVRFALSVREGLALRPWLAWTRVAGVAALVALGLFQLRPGARSTSWLVAMADSPFHRSAAPDHLIPRSWWERELSTREDAAAALLARLSRYAPEPPPALRERDAILRLLRAHRFARGSAAERHGECARLAVDASWGALMQRHGERLCGAGTSAPAPPVARADPNRPAKP